MVGGNIVQHEADCVDFEVDERGEGGVVAEVEGAEEPGAHDVVVEGGGVEFDEGLGGADDGCVDDGDVG